MSFKTNSPDQNMKKVEIFPKKIRKKFLSVERVDNFYFLFNS